EQLAHALLELGVELAAARELDPVAAARERGACLHCHQNHLMRPTWDVAGVPGNEREAGGVPRGSAPRAAIGTTVARSASVPRMAGGDERTLRVAVAQATPVVMDGPASVERACELIREAGAAG